MQQLSKSGIVLLAATLSLGGCATFTGQPEPVISVAMSDEALADYRVPAILRKYRSLSGQAQRAYRDEVMAVYLQAIDARFFQFRGNLSSQGKATNLGFDTLLIGLASAATLSPGSAADLAAISSGALGLRASVDKNLYFDRTLPALLAAMEAERFRIRTGIAEHQAQDTTQYSLAAALVELQEYQQAGTLNSGIATLTSDAAASRANAKATFDKRVRFACDSEDSINSAIAPVSNELRAMAIATETGDDSARAAAVTRFRSAVEAMGVTGTGAMTAAQLEEASLDALLGGFCKLDDIDRLKDRLRAPPINARL